MNPAEWLVRSARLTPDAPALLTGTRLEASYREFCARAAALGAGLASRHGILAGERIALFMGNCREYLEIMYAVWFAGAAVVPINAKLHPREAAWIIADSGARVVFVSAETAGDLGPLVPSGTRLIPDSGEDFAALCASSPLAAPAPLVRDDLAWLFYTSGTTGRPKGVMITAGNLQAMALTYFASVDTVEADDAALYAAPISHGAGLYNFMHVIKGARHVVPESGGFDPDEILDLAPKLGNVSMFAAPTMVKRLVDCAKACGRSGEGIKTIVYGGGPMYLADITDAVDVMGPRFVQIYGQGESPMTITALSRESIADRSHQHWKARLASVGTAQACVTIRIADANGNALPPGATGEILVAGAPVMAGYWQNPEATAQTLRHGWLWTGDRGRMDQDGFLTLIDRSKDVIISGGSNIYPREVEEVLLLHPDVQEAAVVGRAHAEWGEEVVAFIALIPGASVDTDALDRLCLETIARFKRPKAYIAVDRLPKNNYGKVLKTELREWLSVPGGPASTGPPGTEQS